MSLIFLVAQISSVAFDTSGPGILDFLGCLGAPLAPGAIEPTLRVAFLFDLCFAVTDFNVGSQNKLRPESPNWIVIFCLLIFSHNISLNPVYSHQWLAYSILIWPAWLWDSELSGKTVNAAQVYTEPF